MASPASPGRHVMSVAGNDEFAVGIEVLPAAAIGGAVIAATPTMAPAATPVAPVAEAATPMATAEMAATEMASAKPAHMGRGRCRRESSTGGRGAEKDSRRDSAKRTIEHGKSPWINRVGTIAARTSMGRGFA